MRGIDTFWRDCTTQITSCKPWSSQLCPYPSLAKKMKTYLELKGQHIDWPSFNFGRLPMSSPLKTSVQKRLREKKRSKTPTKGNTRSKSSRKGREQIPHSQQLTQLHLPQNPTSEKAQEFSQVQHQEKSTSLTTTTKEYPLLRMAIKVIPKTLHAPTSPVKQKNTSTPWPNTSTVLENVIIMSYAPNPGECHNCYR